MIQVTFSYSLEGDGQYLLRNGRIKIYTCIWGLMILCKTEWIVHEIIIFTCWNVILFKKSLEGVDKEKGTNAEIFCNFDDLHKCTLIAIKVWIKMQTSTVIGKFSLLHYVETFWNPFTRQCTVSTTQVTIEAREPLDNSNHFICTMHNACNLILKNTSSLLKSSCSIFWKALFQQKNNSDIILSWYQSTSFLRTVHDFMSFAPIILKKKIDFKTFYSYFETLIKRRCYSTSNAFCIDGDILAFTAVIVCNTEGVTMRLG